MRFSLQAIAVALMLTWAAGADAQTQPNKWTKACEAKTGQRNGAGVVVANGKLLLVGGQGKGVPCVQAFDPAKGEWQTVVDDGPKVGGGIAPYYQTAWDAKASTLYCLSDGALWTLDMNKKEWKSLGRAEALKDLSWTTMAISPDARKLVVVGSDKRLDNLGWTRTELMDLDSGQWSTLPLPDAKVVAEHKAILAAVDALAGMAGRLRLAWYRDPAGQGTDAQRRDLLDRCKAVSEKMGSWMPDNYSADIYKSISEKRLLDALKSTGEFQEKLDVLAQAQYPVPCSRRNSPLVYDSKAKIFVIFGGDHEDYLLNDTWTLSLESGGWRRSDSPTAPLPLAGHALADLPRFDGIVMYGGYRQTSSTDYGVRPAYEVNPRQLWVYVPRVGHWELLGAWQVERGQAAGCPTFGGAFFGYSSQGYSPPLMGCPDGEQLALVCPEKTSSTWTLRIDPARTDAESIEKFKLSGPACRPLRRGGRFSADFGLISDVVKTNIDNLPANQWVNLPAAPRNPAVGCRKRDWGTSVWDARNEQFLLWGGGHCIRSASTVLHYSPVSGRLVEGYDADEPYSANGGGGYGSSLLGRPWVSTHGYNLYAYDPTSGLLVTSSGYLYDPARMDWITRRPIERPFRDSWSQTVLESSPHGVIAWAQHGNSEACGLWQFDAETRTWTDLKPKGKLYKPYCDSEGMVYDSKRDRMLLGSGGGYGKVGDGSMTEFSFRTHELTKLTPEAARIGTMATTREMVYVDAADWVLFSTPMKFGEGKEAQPLMRVYNCAKNAYFLMDTGGKHPGGGWGQGWQYDARRKLVLTLDNRGDAWALRLDPAAAKLTQETP